MTSAAGKHGRVFDGKAFHDVDPSPPPHIRRSSISGAHRVLPVPPEVIDIGAETKIFVSVPQFRDGKRCGRTLKRLFEMAKYPDRIVVGLIEQTDPDLEDDDPICLREYCTLAMGRDAVGGERGDDEEEGEGESKTRAMMRRDAAFRDCPRVTKQIRSVRFSYLYAKGPVYARSFVRKLLGNEEFCMQIDAATDFAKDWDELALNQWMSIGNEYAVLSNVPERDKNYGIMGDPNVESEVPRQCSIRIGSEGVPLYSGSGNSRNVADGRAIGLDVPLLSTSHSSSFAFARCHLETNVPHDPFATQLLETEKFPRFARMWTRGYDVYTPSRNIVFSYNVALHPLHRVEGHGESGERKWPRNDGERRDAHVRMKVMLNIRHGVTEAMESSSSSSSSSSSGGGEGGGLGERIETARANLGIYGLGKRRTLDQLLNFAGIALPGGSSAEYPSGHGNEGRGCGDPGWVPYDGSVSPRANLYDSTGRADDLDPEPIFPLRTLPDATGGQYDHPFANGNAAWGDMIKTRSVDDMNTDNGDAISSVPYSMILLLWIAGLCVWYGMFVGDGGGAKNRGVGKRTGRIVRKNSPKKLRKKVPLSEVMLKNV
ncbi:hypothetical protein ACHAXA_003402 [Cyclostephanos tholiformis]|uniref:Uncharacterized protein n=1 Tax=Cyclostephanos tholiformis TaxID=382380 RepID=A0ABD3RCZ4_9STRA